MKFINLFLLNNIQSTVKCLPKKLSKKKIQKFSEEQLEKYIKIHKKNEKDLRYIG